MTSTTAGSQSLRWGTNRNGGLYYAGRVHLVMSNGGDGQATALCGLPVRDLWPSRPPIPRRLCPECCIEAISRFHGFIGTAGTA